MLNKITQLFFGSVDKPSPKAIPKSDVKRVVADILQVPRYPPFDNGVPAIDIDSIVQTQDELIQRIKIGFGLSPQNFETYVMSTIRNYAGYIHLLPATNKENHNNAGGMFRLGLEVAFYALQSANGKIFSNKESAEKRRLLHPKWLFATFAAGLCSEMYRTLTTMKIVSPTGAEWPHYTIPLYKWVSDQNADKYFINWTESSNHSFNLNATTSVVMPMILNPQCLNYIDNDNSGIVSCMINSINGTSKHGDGNIIGELVRRAKDFVIENDLKTNATLYGKLTLGSHLEPHIVDIMRELIRNNTWTVNVKQSRVWYTKEGCFIVWTAAFNEIKQVMADRKMTGLPSSADTLAEMLMNSGMIEQHRSGGPFWEITIPNTPKIVETIKIVDPTLILSDEVFPNSEFSLFNPIPKSEPKQQIVATEDKSKTTDKSIHDDQPMKDVSGNQPQQAELAKTSVATDKPADSAQASSKAQDNTKVSAAPSGKTVEPKTAQNTEKQKPVKTVENKPVKQESGQSAATTSILDQMPEHTRNLINAIKSDYHKGTQEFPVWMSARGLVISKDEFESHGIPHIQVLDALLHNNWIARDPENNKVLYVTEKDGVKVKAYVIKRDIALAIGFKEE